MKKLLVYFLLAGSMAIVSCSSSDSSDDVPTPITYQFKDKWWYSVGNTTLDLYFHTNGLYESKYLYNGTTTVSNGEWQWMDQPNKIIHIYNLQNNGVDEYVGKVSGLTAHTLKMKVSFDNGATYTDSYNYTDTNN